jgi:hypothetical protein
VKRLEAVARIMDDAVEIPILGFRVGIDPLLGLLPGAGDVIGATFSGWMVVTAARMGATPATLLRMLLNLGLDAVAGAVPLLGDVFDIAFKANRRNLKIVQEQVIDPESVHRRSRAVVVATVAGTVAAVVLTIGGMVALFWWLAGAVWSGAF